LLHRGHRGPVAACLSFGRRTTERLHQKGPRKHVPRARNLDSKGGTSWV
jgi:hypothetical protein